MKALLLITILLSSFSTSAVTETGTTPMGPPTMGMPTYPNSGSLPTRTDDMTGKDMSDSTYMGSDRDPRVPSRTPTMRQQKEERRTIPKKEKRIHDDD